MKHIPLSRRILWMLLAAAIQCVYLPASQATSGGIAPKLPIDVIPVYPIWVIPYYLTFLVWTFAVIWTLTKADDRQFREILAAALLTTSAGALTFVFFPTYVDLPVVRGSDVFSALLRLVQMAGGNHAALPSAHNYVTMLAAAFAIRFRPRWRWFWLITLTMIALSTLFTGQHYILDMATGLALGWIGYRFGVWWAERQDARMAASAARGDMEDGNWRAG